VKLNKVFSSIRKGALQGALEGISGGVIFGWAINRSSPEKPANLDILIDGNRVGTTSTTLIRSDIAASAPSGHRCGFRFDLRPYAREFRGQILTIVNPATRSSLRRTPLALDANTGWGVVDGAQGAEIIGWAVCTDPMVKHAEVEILLDGKVVGVVEANQPRPDLQRAGVPQSTKCGFRFPVPTIWHDGIGRKISAQIRGTGQPLRDTPGDFVCTIRGHIDSFSKQGVDGWIAITGDMEHPIRFDLRVNGRLEKRSVVPNLVRSDVTQALIGRETSAPVGFHVSLPSTIRWDESVNTVELCLPGTSENLLANTTVAVDRFAVIEQIEAVAGMLNGGDAPGQSNALGHQDVSQVAVRQLLTRSLSDLRREFLTRSLSDLRREFGNPILINVKHGYTRGDQSESRAQPVDVIVPVYKGYEETLDCIRSVLDSDDASIMELVVINDCSPDTNLTAELRKLAAKEQFTLLENEENKGFVATVNRGMRLRTNRDVVLLNADTVVPKGWLRRMRQAAYSSANIGTVTPFSNRATIFSLPRTCHDNDMPLGLSVTELDALCAERNAGVVVDVPTAMGFCMYIRRDALSEVGEFDEKRWAKGYGEENDFCIRAAGLGWRNVAACDVFVQHHGSVSFDTEKAPRVKENLAKLNALYPDYPRRIQHFLKADLLAAPRDKVNMALLKRLAPSYILFVTHGLGGGTEKAIRDLCDLYRKDGKRVLILKSTLSGKLELTPAIADYEKTLITEYPHDIHPGVLAEQLRELSVEYIHFHHTLGFKSDIWRLPELLGVPYDVTIHDFYLICPRTNLIDDSGIYCGQPNVAACERCIKANALDHDTDKRLEEVGGTVSRWREFHADQLRGARRVVAPSEDARMRIQRYLPDQPIDAVPHPESSFTFTQRVWDRTLPYKVAVLGAIGSHKGLHVLLACAKYAQRENLPIKFFVIGYTSNDEAFAELENVEITGKYEPEELPAIIVDSGCTHALFLSVCPETHSFTLTEAWQHGLVPIAFDLGALTERIRKTGSGFLITFPSTPAEIVAAILRAVE
jgi:GT2 family glycosyltransferase